MTETRTQSQEKDKESVPSLMMEIISDGEDLVTQQLTMFKYELKEELRQAKAAMLPLAAGVAIALLGVALLGFMFVHLIHATTTMPLWACFAVVAGICLGGGAALFFWGSHQIDKATPIADDSMDALKENVKWLTKSK